MPQLLCDDEDWQRQRKNQKKKLTWKMGSYNADMMAKKSEFLLLLVTVMASIDPARSERLVSTP